MRRKSCLVCPYYLRKSGYCALLGVKVHDPLKPPCLAESFRQPEVKPTTETTLFQVDIGSEKTPPAVSQKQSVKKSSTARAAAFILFMLLILTNTTWYLEYLRLSTEHSNLVNRYQDLASNYYALLSNYNELNRNFDFLNKSYSSLFFEHVKLMKEYDSLLRDYAFLNDKCAKTCSSFLSLLNELELLAYTPHAFRRVLNWNAVEAIGKYVNESGVNTWDYWGSLQKIYDYIRSKVRYAYDVEIPVPSPPLSPDTNDQVLLGGWSYTMRRNYVQTPEFTIKYGQGDCDDQAVLAYAMIKYYMIKIHGREYELYVAAILFGDEGHLAVFLPVQGGQLTIIDPAGSYLTRDINGRICSRLASIELQNYRNWWSMGKRQIKRIELYSVNVKTGSYKQVASGTLEEIAAFLSKS